MSQRVQKVESLIQQIVAKELIDLLDKSRSRVTVTAVDAAPDLRNAIVWFGVIGGKSEEILEELLELRPELQRRVAKVMTTKFVPKLSFKLDVGGAYADHINRLLKEG